LKKLLALFALIAVPAYGQLKVQTRDIADGAVTSAKVGTDLWTVLSSKALATGANATGTWPISVTGVSGTARQLQDPGLNSTIAWNDADGRWEITGFPLYTDSEFQGSGAGLTNIPLSALPAAVVRTSSTYANPAWITSLAGSKISGNVATATALQDPGTGSGIYWDDANARWTANYGLTADDGFFGNGSGLTGLNGSAVTTGTVPPARLGSGTASSSTYLRGDGAWTAPPFVTVPSTSAFLVGNGSGGVSAGSTTGILKASSGVVSAAVAGTDYLTPTGSGTGLSGVAKTGSANTLTGNQQVNGFLGVGISPTYALHVAPSTDPVGGGTAFFKGANDTSVVIKAGSAQAADLFSVQSAAGAVLTRIDTSGVLYSGGLKATSGTAGVAIATGSGASVTTSTAGNVPLAVNNSSATPTANLQNWQANSVTKSHVSKGGAFVSDDSTMGVVLKDSAGHYWRLTVSTGGVVSTTDQGTTAP
jgi:hypothetical protein